MERACRVRPGVPVLVLARLADLEGNSEAGTKPKALEQLEKAIKIHPVSMKRDAAADPIFAKLKDSAKFKQLVASSGK